MHNHPWSSKIVWFTILLLLSFSACQETSALLPKAPSNFMVSSATSNTINLVWQASIGAGNYSLERKTSTDAYASVANPKTTDYSDTDLTPNTSYSYRLKAINTNGSSTAVELLASTATAGVNAPSIASFTPTSGAVGTTITINGSNLGQTSSLQFNGIASNITNPSASSLQTTVPNGATTGKISLTTPGGTVSSSLNFTVTTPNPSGAVALGDEVFVGPFPSWANAKTDYGAKGDGSTDDSAALQKALDELGQTGKKTILFLPSGTYRISKTLTLEKRVNVAILGEDPSTTSLVWAGGSNPGPDYSINSGVMFLGQNSANVRLGRLTLDGQGKANWAVRLRWGSYASGDYFPTGWQFHDLVFKNADVGIGAGYVGNNTPQDTAEYSQVYRSKFIGCSYAGINTQDYNSLLWGVRDSYFEGNAVGVRVDLGNVNVYDSVFKNSSESDISASTVSFISARGNYSSNSKKFLTSNGNTGVVNLQNNIILDSLEPAINPVNTEEVTLIGNTIRSGTATAVAFDGYGGLLSVGNRFSTTNWLTRNPNQSFVRSLDDTTNSSISLTEPSLAATPSKFAGPIVVVSEFTGAAVQAAIDKAAQQYAGQRPVVYLPGGADQYQIDKTLIVPANSDLQLVGDGASSSLIATTSSPVLQLTGPSRARLQDINLSGGYNGPANALQITNADQAGGAVILNSVSVVGPNTQSLGVDVNGLDQAKVELIMPHYIGGKGGSLRVTGGAQAGANLDQPANVRVIDGFSGVGGEANSYTYQVRSGGRLIALDQWAEVNAKQFLRIETAGSATINGGSFGFGTRPPDTEPVIGADGFNGRLSIIGLLFGNSVLASSGNNPNQNVLLASSRLDGWKQGSSAASRFVNTATAGTTKALFNVGDNIWFDTTPNNTDVSDAWLRTMLKQLLEDRSARLSLPPTGATAVQLTRVSVAIANTAIQISR
jgi:Pectate lyase superfamily protein/IPT/TIG domain/Fibronectin type III domain